MRHVKSRNFLRLHVQPEDRSYKRNFKQYQYTAVRLETQDPSHIVSSVLTLNFWPLLHGNYYLPFIGRKFKLIIHALSVGTQHQKHDL
jgi:hypothetical protein